MMQTRPPFSIGCLSQRPPQTPLEGLAVAGTAFVGRTGSRLPQSFRPINHIFPKPF